LGTRKYKLEHSHTILITDRELIHGFDTNFPTVDIKDNQIIKQIENEWRLNNDLNLTDGDWDHPEFCLEANDANDYVFF
jgi:hypothetical protein